jgi:hypothetical protein
MSYSIATFCYGERYYNQTNRMIESFNSLQEKPEIFIVTDNVDSIKKESFVKVKDIREYDERYYTYQKNYYGFDFSVKRFSLLFAFENGYDNVILTDTDVVINPDLYSFDNVMNSFIDDSIAGQTTYNFLNQIDTNSMLGRRFIHYEDKFKVSFDKSLLNDMPEDCIQFISIKKEKKFDFINTWSECISIKDLDNLHNIPAGNIDEMCFSALLNNIKVLNNSSKSINLLIAKHDKWY